MDKTTIIIIVVLTVVTIVIFVLATLAFIKAYKDEKVLVWVGKKDGDITKDKLEGKKTSYKVVSFLSSLFSFLIAGASIGLMCYALVIKASGDMLFINGRSSLVIASNSMSVYSEDSQLETNGGYLTEEMVKQEFVRGDILSFDTMPSSSEMLSTNKEGKHYTVNNGASFPSSYASPYLNHIFSFKYNNQNIVHRLVNITIANPNTSSETVSYEFQGDKYPGNMQKVTYDKLEAVYDGSSKVQTWGLAILFFSSEFGIYSVATSLSMIILASVFTSRVQKLYNERYSLINGEGYKNAEKQKEELLEASVEDQEHKPEEQPDATIIINGEKQETPTEVKVKTPKVSKSKKKKSS